MELLHGEAIAAEVERVLESDTFRNSDALRRLLKFLADKMMSGEADQLKEYSVGIDALGKPPTYDPRHDSTVRIQVGRLRQKLAEYYRTEGEGDPWIIDLPKGRFKLTCDARPAEAAALTLEAPHETARVPTEAFVREISGTRKALIILSVALAGALAWGAVATLQLERERQSASMFHAMWTPEYKNK